MPEDLDAAVARVRRAGGGPVRWVASAPSDADDRAAAAAGLDRHRDLYQLRRPLPVEAERRAGVAAVTTRGFAPGTADEAAWLEQNNAAFAGHPDQGGQTIEALHRTMAEPWFDPDGFRVLVEDDGTMTASCWTRVHPAGADRPDDPAMGEIYVIGVHPDRAGRGLGAALALDGLDWLHDHGLRTAMLYVDADNEPALRLYRRLGFGRHHTDRVYDGEVTGDRLRR